MEVEKVEVKATCWVCQHLSVYVDVDFKTGEPFYEFYCELRKDEFDVYGLCEEFEVHEFFKLSRGSEEAE